MIKRIFGPIGNSTTAKFVYGLNIIIITSLVLLLWYGTTQTGFYITDIFANIFIPIVWLVFFKHIYKKYFL